jgi:hypothetical protein
MAPQEGVIGVRIGVAIANGTNPFMARCIGVRTSFPLTVPCRLIDDAISLCVCVVVIASVSFASPVA